MPAFRVAIGDELFDLPPQIGPYNLIRPLGSGAFSVVVLVRDPHTLTDFACKVVSRAFLTQTGTFHCFEQELRLLEMLHHPHVVEVVDVIYSDTLIFVVMEYCSGGELFQFLAAHGPLNEDDCRVMFAAILDGLSDLHSRGIAHRDLKPDNILISNGLQPKISDLGLSHNISVSALAMTPCGSPQYAAPEVLLGKGYDARASDAGRLALYFL